MSRGEAAMMSIDENKLNEKSNTKKRNCAIAPVKRFFALVAPSRLAPKKLRTLKLRWNIVKRFNMRILEMNLKRERLIQKE